MVSTSNERLAKTSPDQYNVVLAIIPNSKMSEPEHQKNAEIFFCSDSDVGLSVQRATETSTHKA